MFTMPKNPNTRPSRISCMIGDGPSIQTLEGCVTIKAFSKEGYIFFRVQFTIALDRSYLKSGPSRFDYNNIEKQ